jgi:hypothetical protein
MARSRESFTFTLTFVAASVAVYSERLKPYNKIFCQRCSSKLWTWNLRNGVSVDFYVSIALQ